MKHAVQVLEETKCEQCSAQVTKVVVKIISPNQELEGLGSSLPACRRVIFLSLPAFLPSIYALSLSHYILQSRPLQKGKFSSKF